MVAMRAVVQTWEPTDLAFRVDLVGNPKTVLGIEGMHATPLDGGSGDA